MDVAHHQRSAAARENRARILQESARHLDPEWTAKQARRNVNVDPSRTDQNVLMVNDGQGGFRETKDIDEVLDYGDARDARVRRKIDEKSRTLTTIVGHLPKSMCEERTRKDAKGKTRKYYVPRDRDEARRYFARFVDQQALNLPGGHGAIHGWAINWDEMTPHIQMLGDNYGEDPKSTDPAQDLRQMYHQAWGSHREVKDEQGRQMGGSVKMERYQAQLRELMVSEGFPVTLEPDPVRRKRKQSRDDYIELEEGKEQQAQTQQKQDARAGYLERWGASLAEQEDDLQDRGDELEERLQQVDQREAEVQQRAEKVQQVAGQVAAQRRAVVDDAAQLPRVHVRAAEQALAAAGVTGGALADALEAAGLLGEAAEDPAKWVARRRERREAQLRALDAAEQAAQAEARRKSQRKDFEARILPATHGTEDEQPGKPGKQPGS